MAAVCLAGASLGMVGVAHAANVDVQISSFTDSPDPATRGGTITYTTVLKNGGPAVATDVVVSWPVPANTSFVSINDGAGGGTCSHDGATPGTVTCSYASVAVDDLTSSTWKTIALVIQTNGTTPNTVASSVSVTQTGNTDTNAGNDSLTQNTTISNGADLSFAIVGAPNPAAGAANVTWTISGTNNGPNASGPITVTVPLPGTVTYVSSAGSGWTCSGTTTLSCTRASVASGAAYPDLSIVTKISAQVSNGTLTVGGSISQTAVGDPVSANDSATASVAINPGLDLQLTQDAASPASANAGGVSMTFVLRPSNLGPYDATTGANVSFPLPAGFGLSSASGTNGWTCSSAGSPITVTCGLGSNLASGAGSVLTIVTTTPSTVSASTNYTLTGTVAVNAGGPIDPISSNNTAARTVTVVPVGLDLGLTKTKSPAIVAQNANMTSTLTVSNAAGGVAAAAGTITVTDVLDTAFETYVPADNPNPGTNWTCVSATVGTVTTVTCTYNAALASGVAPGVLTLITKAMASGTATNHATVAYSGTPGDYNPANNGPIASSVTVTAVPNSPDLVAGLTLTTPGGVASTLEFNETTVTYVATLTNSNASPALALAAASASDTRMVLTLPAVISGSSILGSIGVTVTNTSGTSNASYNCPSAGILNSSTITCTQASGTLLKSGDSVSFSVPVSRPLAAGTFTNPPNVSVSSTTQGDPNPGNNTASASVTIDPIADIELVSKNITSANPAKAGTNVTYVLTIQNNGPSTADGVSVVDVFTIPAGDNGFTFVSATPSGTGSCSGLSAGTVYGPGTATLTCAFGSVSNGTTETVTVVVLPNWMAGIAQRSISNTATVTTTTKENSAGTDNGNNSKTATLIIDPAQVNVLINNTDLVDPLGYDPAAVAIGTASTNNDITYDVSMSNGGPSLATGVAFTYTMTPPAGKTVVFRGDGSASNVASATSSGTIANSICSNVGSSVTGSATLTLTCTFAAPGQLASGAAAMHRYLVFRVQSAPVSGGDTYNTNATVITNETDLGIGNKQVGQTTTVRQRVDLTIAKTSSLPTVQLRQPFTWTITLTNNGPGNSDTTTLTDTLPVGMEFFGAAPSFTTTGVSKTGVCTTVLATRLMTCNISTGSGNPLNAGEVATVTVPVRVIAYPASGSTTTNCASATTDQVDPAAGNNTNVCSSNVTVQRSSLAGVVFNDPDRNGLFAYTTGAAGTDAGINGTAVVLTGTDAYGNAVNLTQSTAGSGASAGAYAFGDLSPADAAGYTITETQPLAYINGPINPPAPSLSGTPTAGDQGAYNKGGTASNSSYTAIKVAGNQVGSNYNFPELRMPSLSGRVYVDVNGDNSYTSGTDAHIGAATVVLRNAADNSQIAITSTAASGGSLGTYSFANLDPLMTYVLEEPLPTGLTNRPTAVNVGTVNGASMGSAAPNTPIANTDQIRGIDLSSGIDGINYNFGESGTLATTKLLTSVNGAAPGASVKAGDVLLYTVVVTATAGSASTTLCETTPANTSYTGTAEGWSAAPGTCPTGTTHNQVIAVNVGTSVSKTYTVTVVNPLPDSVTSIDNSVTVANGACAACTVSKPTVAKLAIQKSVASANVNGGQTATYTLTVSNLGGSSSSGAVTLSDTLPTGLSYAAQASGTLAGMVCSAAGQVVTCTGTPNLAAGASGTVIYSVNVAVTATGTLTNDVKFSTGAIGGDPRTPSCNAASPAAGANSQSSDKLCAKASVTVTTSISGVVFNDRNRSGIKDASEPGIAGVSLTLVAGSNCASPAFSYIGLSNPVTTAVSTGAYSFSPLPYGAQYTICETQPTGYADGPIGAGTSITVGALPAAGSAGNNFPEVLGSLSGTVFADYGSTTAGNNNNGSKETGEAGIGSATLGAGVPVVLTGTRSSGPTPSAVSITAYTDALGNYSFDDLFPGTYLVTEGAIPLALGSFNDGINTAGPVSASGKAGTAGAVGVNTISAIGLAAGSQGTGNNFAKLPITSISGTVYLDLNESGIMDDTPTDGRLGGVLVTLYPGAACSGTAVSTATTNDTGAYSFPSLSSGLTYTVCETQPPGYLEGTVNPGTNGALTAATINAITISNLPVTGSSANNFGERGGTLSGFVYVDSNNNGSKDTASDPTEVGLAGVHVTLSGTTIAGVDICSLGIVCSPKSSATGAFSFIGVPPGTYQLVKTQGDVDAAVYADGKETAGLAGGVVNNSSFGSLPYQNTINNIVITPAVLASSAGNVSGYLFGEVPRPKQVLELKPPIINGYIYMDRQHSRIRPSNGTLEGQPNWTVTLSQNGAFVCAVSSDANGFYQFDNLHCPAWPNGLPTGTGFAIRFSSNGNNLPNLPTSGGDAGTTAAGTISGITLNPNEEISEQNLPLDPAGVVYDVLTRQPVAGATVRISGPLGFNPATHLVGGSATQVTGLDGRYSFWLQNAFPDGAYSLAVTAPASYYQGISQILPPCTAAPLMVGASPNPGLVEQSEGAPALTVKQHVPTACVGMLSGGALSTQYYLSFTIVNGVSAPILNNHIPLDPVTPTQLTLTKTGDKKLAQVGDTVLYTIAVRNGGGTTLPQVTVKDRLPAGFSLVKGTARVNGIAVADPLGGLGPVLGFNLGSLAKGSSSSLTYRIRVGVGSQQGNGINTARAYGCGYATGCLDPVSLQALPHGVESNQGQYKVEVNGGVFTDEACVLGKIFVDCNNNHVQEPEELGIPGVRLYFEDGYYMVSDVEGKYSRCGIAPRSHVLTADPSTLPKGARLTTSSNRNLGDANSLFIDLKNGELHRADFIEGSCSNLVLEQVKARRTQGEVRSVETEKGPALRFQSKSAAYPQQGTDSANQPLVQTRQGAGDAR